MRSFDRAVFQADPEGLTVLTGPNGAGKTTVLEAVAFVGTHRSFRTANRESLVQTGEERAIIRALLRREGRPLTVESELVPGRSPRTLVNHRPTSARSALAEAVPVTVFSPEDLGVVQGPPARRRELLDSAIRLVDHRAGSDLDVLERVLRQRAALLKQASGRLTADVATTLDVWDARLADAGERVAEARRALAEAVEPQAAQAYADLAGGLDGSGGRGAPIAVRYRPSWDGDLAGALAARRTDDVRRAATTVGPHRDDVELALYGRDARTHASQGEQRSVALALRLALHRLVAERTGHAPILLLDDVFSELDQDRSRELARHLPPGQALLTTAAPLPPGLQAASVVDVRTLGSPA